MNKKIHKTEERFKIIATVTNEVMWDWDLISDSIWWGDNYYNYLGYKKEKTTQNSGSLQASIHQEDRARVLAEIKYFISIKQGFWSAQYRFLKANFTILNIYNRGNIFYDDAGKPIRIIGSMMDISDLKKN